MVKIRKSRVAVVILGIAVMSGYEGLVPILLAIMIGSVVVYELAMKYYRQQM